MLTSSFSFWFFWNFIAAWFWLNEVKSFEMPLRTELKCECLYFSMISSFSFKANVFFSVPTLLIL